MQQMPGRDAYLDGLLDVAPAPFELAIGGGRFCLTT